MPRISCAPPLHYAAPSPGSHASRGSEVASRAERAVRVTITNAANVMRFRSSSSVFVETAHRECNSYTSGVTSAEQDMGTVIRLQ